MNIVYRQRWVAVCLLCALLAGHKVSAQFLDAEIIAAEDINAAMRAEMLELIAPAAQKLASGVPADVSAARQTLITPLRDGSATSAFKLAYSELLESRIKKVAASENVLIRINAMIVLGRMTDEKSKPLIIAGLEDESVAVRRKAIEALRLRVQQYLLMPPSNETAQQGIKDAMQTVKGLMSQDPPAHTIVVSIATRILLDIDSLNSQVELAGYLNDRVALHASEPGLSYDAERSAIDRLANTIAISRPFPDSVAPPVIRAAYRYSLIAVGELAGGKLEPRQQDEALAMLRQCLLALSSITDAAGKSAPADHIQAATWLREGDWTSIKELVETQWPAVLKEAPFSLTDEQLAVK